MKTFCHPGPRTRRDGIECVISVLEPQGKTKQVDTMVIGPEHTDHIKNIVPERTDHRWKHCTLRDGIERAMSVLGPQGKRKTKLTPWSYDQSAPITSKNILASWSLDQKGWNWACHVGPGTTGEEKKNKFTSSWHPGPRIRAHKSDVKPSCHHGPRTRRDGIECVILFLGPQGKRKTKLTPWS